MSSRVKAILIFFIMPFFLDNCNQPATMPPTLLPTTQTGILTTQIPFLTQTPIPTHTPLPTLSGSGGGVIAYCLSPSSGKMQLHEVNLDGSEDRILATSHQGVNHMDWSPDGQKFVAVVYMDSSFTTWAVYVFDADGSNPARLTNTAGAADTEPAWSPDGTRILFTRVVFTSEREYTSQIMIMNTDGSGQTVIVEDGFAAKWSPDSTHIIYSSGKTGNHELYLSNPDGSDEQRLTNTSSNESYPSWSPDGKQIAFTSSTGEWNSVESEPTFEIFIMNSDGTRLRQLTDNDAADSNPRWSPDGTSIAFSSGPPEKGLYNIYVMNADGTNLRQVTHIPGGARAINPVWKP